MSEVGRLACLGRFVEVLDAVAEDVLRFLVDEFRKD
jgi:hypothetical protein